MFGNSASLRSSVDFIVFGALLFAWSAFAYASVGVNKYDLMKQYTGYASGGDGSPRYVAVTQAMARKALGDARHAGVPFVRVAIGGFAPVAPGKPGDLDLWRARPDIFWARIDLMMDDLDAAEVKLIPTFVWNRFQFPAMTGETVQDLIAKPNSASFALLERFVSEFVTRYKARPTVLFYELTNELNLAADLDALTRCRKGGAAESTPVGSESGGCAVAGNFSTNEMIGFAERLAGVIRRIDSGRSISSGYSVPRRSAEHLRRRPEWSKAGTDWTADSKQEFEKYLADTHKGLEIISVHLYPTEANLRFGSTDSNSVDLLMAVHAAAKRIGKPLFVGEFGNSARLDAKPDNFTVRMLGKLAELKVPYSAVWVWQFYQTNLYQTRNSQASSYSLEPGFTDALIDNLAQVNALGGTPKAPVAAKDVRSPTVVLTWPLACTRSRSLQGAHAVASDDSGRVARVDFYVGETLLAQVEKPPYQAVINSSKLAPGEYVLKARALDAAGNAGESSTTVVVGKPPAVKCLKSFP